MEIVKLTLGAYDEHTYLINDGAFCAVIDPEESGGQIAKALAERGWSPDVILLTHAHFDHLRGVNELPPGIPLYAHSLDAPYVPGRNLELGEPFAKEQTIDREIRALEDGDAIGPFLVAHMPGHSPGSVLYIAPGHVFSGDSLFVHGRPFLAFPLSDEQAYAAALERMRGELDRESRLHAGHGTEGTVKEGLYP